MSKPNFLVIDDLLIMLSFMMVFCLSDFTLIVLLSYQKEWILKMRLFYICIHIYTYSNYDWEISENLNSCNHVLNLYPFLLFLLLPNVMPVVIYPFSKSSCSQLLVKLQPSWISVLPCVICDSLLPAKPEVNSKPLRSTTLK